MISSKLRNLIIAKFDNLTAYNNHKSDSDLANALMLVPDEPEYIFGNDTAGGIIWPKSGFCIQWGVDNRSSDTEQSMQTYFPIAFNQCFVVLVSVTHSASDGITINSFNKTGFSRTNFFNFDITKRVVRMCNYIALGKISA